MSLIHAEGGVQKRTKLMSTIFMASSVGAIMKKTKKPDSSCHTNKTLFTNGLQTSVELSSCYVT